MSPRQRRVVAVLVLANILIIVALAALVRYRLSLPLASAPSPTRLTQTATAFMSPTRAPRTRTPLATAVRLDGCEWQAVQMLAQGRLSGGVMAIPGEAIRFEMIYPLEPGQSTDDAAQSVWAAFDVALFLHGQEGCASLPRVEVVVVGEGDQGDTRISASVGVADLVALDRGELSEDAFIDRVIYTTSQAP